MPKSTTSGVCSPCLCPAALCRKCTFPTARTLAWLRSVRNSDSSAKIACSGKVVGARDGKQVAGKSQGGRAGVHRHRNPAAIEAICTYDQVHS